MLLKRELIYIDNNTSTSLSDRNTDRVAKYYEQGD